MKKSYAKILQYQLTKTTLLTEPAPH